MISGTPLVLSKEPLPSWIGRLQAGDSDAAQRLWVEYFPRLVRLARRKLGRAPRRVSDEEDLALSAIKSFCSAAAEGRFPQLADRDDLWRLLATITARKTVSRARESGRQKRGGGRVRGESVFGPAERDDGPPGIEQVVGREPTPAFAAEMADQLRRLLNDLQDDTLRSVAILKMQGYTNDEIAGQLGCALRSVERKLQGIRAIWSRGRVDDDRPSA